MGCGWPRRAGGGHHARQAFRTGDVGRPLTLRVGVHIQRSPFGIQVSEKSAPQGPKIEVSVTDRNGNADQNDRFARLLPHADASASDIGFRWAWSIWRRPHQANAKRAHYRKFTMQLQL